MSAHSEQNAVVTGVIEFASGDRPAGPFTVTVLVEDVSRADAPSAIVGGARFENPAFGETEEAQLPFAVTVPTNTLTGVRRLNVRVHVREGLLGSPNVTRPNVTRPNVTRPNITRPNITEGDFVSTQSHPVLADPVLADPVLADPVLSGSASVRIPVLRV
ncbi:MAG: hypothetical protein LH475_13440 [Cryobacterium sp.]|uniref:hypothetical protein n=1 Tax=unclassified Cryobacterium TaxID=2649013 RepID=UPI0018C919A1|nr:MULTISPECIES: hypothetical protein [unclassified Cryobacterium]MCY7405602.1 hypothetical protein [Cryobacterium sp.]